MSEDYIESPPKLNNHIAGIIPISGRRESSFNMPWHDVLMPITEKMNLVEQAVFNCAWMGCSSIWIVANEDVSPLIRKRIGERVPDPYQHYEKSRKGYYRRRKIVPIYYVKTDPIDYDKRDSYPYSVLHGARVVSKLTSSLSRWMAPDRYYISWPFCVLNSREVAKQHRTKFTGGNLGNTLSYAAFSSPEGKTIFDGEYLPAYLSPSMLNFARQMVYKKTTGFGVYEKTDENWWNQINPKTGLPRFPKLLRKLKSTERDSARWFDIKDVFGDIKDSFDIPIIQLDHYNKVDNWNNYREYMGGGNYIEGDKYFNKIHPSEIKPMCLDHWEFEDK